MFSIGVGEENRLNLEVLKQMATEPVVDHVKHALTVEGINTFKNALASQICKEAEEKSSCDSAAMDLALVLDGSDSVGNEDFGKLKEWTKDFIDNLQIDKYGAQVGVIKYATIIREVSPLSSDIDDLKVCFLNYLKKMKLIFIGAH